MNIALVNEIAIMADKLGIDVWEVTEARGRSPFDPSTRLRAGFAQGRLYGFMKFTPPPAIALLLIILTMPTTGVE